MVYFIHLERLYTMLQIENLTFNYSYKDELIFSNLNLTLSHPQLVYLIGQNGSGKTTLLKLLAQFAKARSGVIKYNHLEITYSDTSFVQTQNECSFPNLTGKETLELFFSLNHSFYNRELPWLKTLYKSSSFCQALEMRYSDCSTGMRQLLNIAIGLTKQVPIYLFDEPFVSLDDSNRELLLQVFEELAREHYVFISDHRVINEMKDNQKLLISPKGVSRA